MRKKEGEIMPETILTVTHPVGLHARPATLFVKSANKFQSKITVKNVSTDSKFIDAKSIISILTLGVQKGHQIQVTATGVDADEALRSLTELVESNFGEA
jgi:phosphotransferase system HPr (HPr) family protein